MKRTTVQAPAKINLRLKVLGKRDDGYHDLDMIMVPLTLADDLTLEICPQGISVDCDHPALKNGQQNLVVKAAQYTQKHWGFDQGCHMTLVKKTPLAGGLGGGSSDAAAVLKALTQILEYSLESSEFPRIAHEIGADVPFFLTEGPQRVCGIGEVLEPLHFGFDLPLILINPGVEVSTKEVFQTLKMRLTSPRSSDSLPRSYGRLGDLDPWIENDLEPTTCQRHGVIDRLKKSLMDHGAAKSLMSGSGPTVFGVFEQVSVRDKAFELVKKDFSEFWIAKTEMKK